MQQIPDFKSSAKDTELRRNEVYTERPAESRIEDRLEY